MLPGPVFNVELLTTARRPRYYVFRVIYGMALLVIVWQNYASWDRYGGGSFRPQQMTQFALSTFFSLVVLQALLVLNMTPSLVAGVIANEKQRKTLHYLMASDLTSPEIVLGKLMARMLHVAVFLAIGLPVMSLLSLFGGVDPQLVMLSVAGTFSAAFFLASLSVFCSAISKRVREAITAAYLLEAAWLFIPPMVRSLMPWVYPNLYHHVQPLNEWLMASTPWAPLMALAMSWRGSGMHPLVEATLWMTGLQLAAGVVLVALAVWRLRPVFMAQEGARAFRFFGLSLGKKSRRVRLFGRKPVADAAMLWKEMSTSRTSGTAQVVGFVVAMAVVGVVAYWTWVWGVDAFGEVTTESYYNRGVSRSNFNGYLRFITTTVGVLSILAAAVGGANTLTSEREDDTWISLVATPMDGSEIVGAKMIGVVWKIRWGLILLGILWTVGMVCGSIHPVGALIEAVELAAFIGFATALGTFFSVESRSSWRSQATTIGVLVMLSGGYLMCCIPVMFAGRPSFLIVSGCMPFIAAVSLLAPWEVAEIFLAGGSRYSNARNEEVEIVMACFVGTIGYAVAGFFLTMAAISGFERAADRPRRDEYAPPLRSHDTRPNTKKLDDLS